MASAPPGRLRNDRIHVQIIAGRRGVLAPHAEHVARLEIGKLTLPATTSRCIGCSRNSKPSTTPKLPPPPRTPQNSSLFSAALACRSLSVGRDQVNRVEVVDGHADSGAPGGRIHRPVSDRPRRYARPCRAESRAPAPALRDPPGRAACRPPTQTRLVCGSTRTPRIPDRSICSPRSQVDWPECAVAAALHRHQQVVCAREFDHRLDVGRARGLRDQGRVLVERRIQDHARLVVAGSPATSNGPRILAARSRISAASQRDFAAIAGDGQHVGGLICGERVSGAQAGNGCDGGEQG